MLYEVRLTDQVKIDLVQLAKSEPKAFAKANRFLEELRTHPKTGTGHPEPLKGKPGLVPRDYKEAPHGVPHLRYRSLC